MNYHGVAALMRATAAAFLSFSLVSLGTASVAREVVWKGNVDGKDVVMFDGGFWRFDDSGGARCTKIAHVGDLCALPASWAPFPQTNAKALRPRFFREGFEGFVTSLTPTRGPIEARSINLTLSEIASVAGGPPTVLQKGSARLDDLDGQQIVYVHLDRVMAFSIFDQNGRILIFYTETSGFTLFHKDHQTAHQDLINSVELEKFDG